MVIKMNRVIVVMMAFLIMSCSDGHSQKIEHQALEYRNAKDEFTVVVVKNGHMSTKQAKKEALRRAAISAKKFGYRSFEVIEEQEVEVMLGKKDWPSAYDFPQNLYQEEIIEKGYNRERIISGSKSDYKLRKALKIKVKCLFSESKGSYKVCEIIKC